MTVLKFDNTKNIKEGDFITVVKWTSHIDNSYRGDCLEVKVVDLPYLRVYQHDGFLKGKTCTLNLNQVEIKPLSEEFVASVMEELKSV